MNYATTAGRPNPLAALGALGVPAGVGMIMIAGLAVNMIVTPPIPTPTGTHVTPEVVVTPEPVETSDLPPSDSTTSQTDATTQIVRPPPRDTDFDLGSTGPLTSFDDFDPGSLLGSEGLGTGLPPIEPVVDPVDATPRGNPGNWITTADYRTSWIRREYTGTARFTLQIDERGRVSGCSITGSTGHAVLDKATCSILERRAIFNPAKGSDGEPVAGTYASSVNWTIPE